MKRSSSILKNSAHGFSLVETLFAMALGLIVVGAGVSLFSTGMDVSFTVSQRAQMQQDVRAAQAMLIRDISLAGAGLPSGGTALPSGTATSPRLGCDQAGVCYVPLSGAGVGGGITIPGNYLYWIIVDPGKGPVINATAGATDVITVVYADTNFLLSGYSGALNATGTAATFTMPAPAPVPVPQNVDDPVVGLKPGDLVFIQNSVGFAVGEVTGPVVNAGGTYTVPFAAGDTLRFNQNTATASLRSISAGLRTQATRIWMVTYYLNVLPDPGGVGPGTPRLMRQVNGQAPVPLAENVADLRFTYDTYDANNVLQVNLADAGASLVPPVSPNMIRKVNISRLIARSPLRGTKGYQSIDLSTEVSVRNMSFNDRYQ